MDFKIGRLAAIWLALAFLASPIVVHAEPACSFTLGFAVAHAARPDVVGDCRENVTATPGGSAQQTTKGTLIWRQAYGLWFTGVGTAWEVVGPTFRLHPYNDFAAVIMDCAPGYWVAGICAVPQPAPQPAYQTSPNWGGYVLTGGPFVQIHARWIVPVTYTGIGHQAAWAGIGGWQDAATPLLQAGSALNADGVSTVSPYAWVEDFPAATTTVPLDVSPGDEMDVTLTQTSGPFWRVDIWDGRNGVGYSQTYTQAYAPNQTSAEWIFETNAVQTSACTWNSASQLWTACGSGASSVANSSMVSFRDAWAKTADGRVHNLDEAQPINMINNGQVVRSPHKTSATTFGV